MKKFLTLLFVSSLLFVGANTVKAQDYYVYDNDTNPNGFNMMLTYNGNKLQAVSFSSGNKWVDFTTNSYVSLENSRAEQGFTITVVDGKGVTFYVDYLRRSNYMLVTNAETDEEWYFYPRE